MPIKKRRNNLYKPNSAEPFKVSRSKIDLFLECPLCFYLDRRLGISRPDMPGWSLNSAVDNLLKNEFDILRENKMPHGIMASYGVNATPFWHEELHAWRDDNHKKEGACFLHKKTNLKICGIIDDIWQNTKTKELHIVDYKSTSTNSEISLGSKYKEGYKRQMEIYQWIFRQLGFNISPIGYFLFANADKNKEGFYSKLEFKLSIIPYRGDDSWIGKTLLEIKKCLDSESPPKPGPDCQHCAFRDLANREILTGQTNLI